MGSHTSPNDDPTFCTAPNDELKDYVCRGRFPNKISVGPCALCTAVLALIAAGVGQDDPRVVKLKRDHTQCEGCSTHGLTGFIKITELDGKPLCQRCVEDAGLVDPALLQKRHELSDATQKRLKKVAAFAAPMPPPPPPPPPPNAFLGCGALNDSTNTQPPLFTTDAILAARLQLQQNQTSAYAGTLFRVAFFPAVLNKPSMSKSLPDVPFKASGDEFVLDLAAKALVSINDSWVKLPISSRVPIAQEEIEIRIKNTALKRGTLALSVAEFFGRYTDDNNRAIYPLQPDKKLKVTKTTLCIDLTIAIFLETFLMRVNGHVSTSQKRSLSASTSQLTSMAKRFRGDGRLPSQLFSRVSKSAPGGAGSGLFGQIHFVFSRIILNPDNGSAEILWNDGGDAEIKSGLLAKDVLARGASKVVYKLNYGSAMYAVKRFINVGKEGPVTEEDNREALEDEVHNIIVGGWLRNKFCDTAQHKDVEICTEFTFTDVKLIREVSPATATTPATFGTAWMLEPLRPAHVVKFSGTMVHPPPKTPLEKTIHAFVHYVFELSKSKLVYADLQGTPGVVNGEDGIHLFDPMVHTPEKCNSVGDHGDEGIETWKSQHKCGAICKGMDLTPFTTGEESESDG